MCVGYSLSERGASIEEARSKTTPVPMDGSASTSSIRWCRERGAGRLELGGWLLPIDLADHAQICRIDIHVLGPLERRQIAALDVGAQDVLRDPRGPRRLLEGPAPSCADAQAKLARPRANGGLAATERLGDRDGGLDAELGEDVSVLIGGPWRPARVGQLNACRGPGGAEIREMPQYGIRGGHAWLQRSQALDQASPVAASRRRLAGGVMKGDQPGQDTLACPPHPPGVRARGAVDFERYFRFGADALA